MLKKIGMEGDRREREWREKEQVEREKADKEQNSVDPEPYYPCSPQYVPSFDSEVAPALTDTLVPAPEQENKVAEQEEDV